MSASDDRTLASVAAADGYTYAWLPTEAGVVLTRPGLRVVLHPGRLFYEVNNATPIADRAPSFNGEDLVISPALANRLGEIAARSSSPLASTAAATPASMMADRVPGKSQALTIATKLVPGRMALALSGTGTPNTSITITLTGEISKDLPELLIRRASATIDANGTYAIQMSYGPDAHAKTLITATAVPTSGTDRAVATIRVEGAPSGVTSTGLDDWPKN